jgi:hypothetical protein
LQELAKRKQRLEHEVRALEDRKRKAVAAGAAHAKPAPAAKPAAPATKPLTPEQMAVAQVKAEEARAARKAEAEALRAEPLKHNPFAVLADIEAAPAEEVQQ